MTAFTPAFYSFVYFLSVQFIYYACAVDRGADLRPLRGPHFPPLAENAPRRLRRRPFPHFSFPHLAKKY